MLNSRADSVWIESMFDQNREIPRERLGEIKVLTIISLCEKRDRSELEQKMKEEEEEEPTVL